MEAYESMLKPQKSSKATLWQVVFLLLPTHVCPYAWYWYCGSQVDVIYNNCYLSQNVISCFLSVVVITHPSHGWSRRFDPGRKHKVNFNPRYGIVDSSNPCYWEASKSLELPVLEFSWKLGASQPIVWTCKNTIVSATINCIINLMPKRICCTPGWAWITNLSVNSICTSQLRHGGLWKHAKASKKLKGYFVTSCLSPFTYTRLSLCLILVLWISSGCDLQQLLFVSKCHILFP